MIRKSNLPLLAIVAEGLLSRLSFGMIGFALPLYARHLGLSLAQVGVLVALNSAVSVALKPMLGWAADRFGLKRTFMTAIALRSVVSLLFAGAGAPWELFAIRGAHGLSASMRDPAANTLIAEHGGRKTMASAFAWYQTARMVASSLSKALAGVLLAVTAFNYPLVFLLAFAISSLALLVVALLVPADNRGPVVQQAAAAVALEEPRSARPRVASFVGLGFLIAATAEMLSGLFPVLATEYAGLTTAQTGAVYTVSTLVAVFAGPFFGWLADHVSGRLVLAVRSVANTVSSLLYVLWPSFAGMGIAKTVDDMGKAAFRPAWGSLMATVASYDRCTRARTISWLSMGEDAGGVVAPMLAGFLWSTWGITAVMAVRIVLAIVTEAYAFVVQHPAKRAASVKQHTAEAGPKPAQAPVLAQQ
jgi:MFS family permease